MNIDLNWIRNDVMKDPSEINWLGVSEAAAKLYAEKTMRTQYWN